MINEFVFYLEVGLEPSSPQRTETRGKKFLKKPSFQVRVGPVKRTETRKQGRDEKTQEHRCTCFCPFYRSIPNLKWNFFRNFSLVINSTPSVLTYYWSRETGCESIIMFFLAFFIMQSYQRHAFFVLQYMYISCSLKCAALSLFSSPFCTEHYVHSVHYGCSSLHLKSSFKPGIWLWVSLRIGNFSWHSVTGCILT